MKTNNVTWSEILDKVGQHEVRKGIHSFINPYSMLKLEHERDVGEQVDYWYIDGISLLNKANKILNKDFSRFSFDETSLAPVVFGWAKRNNVRVAIVGTTPEYIEKAVLAIQQRFSIHISYYRNGYFTDNTEKCKVYETIVKKKIDLIVCGMGTPNQEKFLLGLREYGWNGVGYTCGGFLHQIAKKQNYYPKIFDKLNLRWLYRIIDEPKLFKRYFGLYPIFFIKLYFFIKRSR
ncbi:WecB/TagA/CpsF family glycosyltransferase [Sphingobacterium multivorum]|uniref:WecB/TagA/CpsF family glycosyltransferase n=1 Tax=Sphingobacterium multivorum TaxID=28454 RepID=UPI003DA1E0A0